MHLPQEEGRHMKLYFVLCPYCGSKISSYTEKIGAYFVDWIWDRLKVETHEIRNGRKVILCSKLSVIKDVFNMMMYIMWK